MNHLDELIEAQNKVIRHVLDFMDRHSRRTRTLKGKAQHRAQRKPGALIHGMRRIEAELRREFGFSERKCRICGRWLSDKRYNRHPDGRAGLLSRCKMCARLARIYGTGANIPRDVLADMIANDK